MNSTSSVECFGEITQISAGIPVAAGLSSIEKSASREKTITYRVLRLHEKEGGKSAKAKQPDLSASKMNLKFDALVSHDITYVSIIQTARASGMKQFPLPYALTNCHNSLCAVGGTINKDDHMFGLSAAMKYGGIYVPANLAVIHQYARETLTGCGKMILGSDSHTRYGCYGTLGIGEGGGELVRQLLGQTYDIDKPEVALIWLEGSPKHGVGPHDIALALIRETFPQGKVKNKILEFAGPGLKTLSMDFRVGIDVMTTETSCLSSIWETDDTVKAYYGNVGRQGDYAELKIMDGACYDSMVRLNLSAVEAMISLPFHPSKAFTIHELQREPKRILKEVQDVCNSELDGQVKLDLLSVVNSEGQVTCQQGSIVGCAGGLFDSISEAADILYEQSIGNGYFDLSIYPSSMPVSLEISRHGISEILMRAGAVIKPSFCGPCFGAGDTPAHNMLSVRHATRNFANREGSKPEKSQISAVALMDARSIAATARNKGVLTAATDTMYNKTGRKYIYDGSVYEKRCYYGFGNADSSVELRIGSNIADWPKFAKLKDDMLLKLCAVIHDDVTTTDELIPSGETSSYRSNPVALAEYTLSRRAPRYVAMCKEVRNASDEKTVIEIAKTLRSVDGDMKNTSVGSCIFARKPGDGSAREQAASCQRVLGGLANICYEYATKRYRSNCINWGIVPFAIDKDEKFNPAEGDWIYIPNIREALLTGRELIVAKVMPQPDSSADIKHNAIYDITLKCENLSDEERVIITEGCLINYYTNGSTSKIE